MANHCVFCDTRWPPEPVKTIILGEDWFEFCAVCGDDDRFAFENAETGERLTPAELFEKLASDDEG